MPKLRKTKIAIYCAIFRFVKFNSGENILLYHKSKPLDYAFYKDVILLPNVDYIFP